MRQPIKINETIHKMGEPTGEPRQTLSNNIWTWASSLSHLCLYLVWWCLPCFSCGLPHSVYNLLWAAPFCVQSLMGCPTISYVLPHFVYYLLCAASFCILSSMGCPILCTISCGLPHIVYNLLRAAPYCVQFPMGCPILCTISYVLPHFVYNLIDFHRFSHLFLYMGFPMWHIPGLEIPWNCSLVPGPVNHTHNWQIGSHTHTHTHTPVSYTHLTLPTRRCV